MATRNIVPRATGEGSIGTPEKTWGSINAEGINVYSERTAPVNTLQRETAYAVDDIVYTSKLSAKHFLLCVTAGTTAAVEPSFANVDSNSQVTDGTVVWRVQTVTSQEKAAGVPIGFEYFSMNPNVPQGSLPLFGGEYSRSTYADLWAWVQTQTGYLKTEAEWQTLSTANNGNVPYYSSGDGSTTFRVPSLKCWVKGANGTVSEVGSYLAAGLPNITGTAIFRGYGTNGSILTNANGSFAAPSTAGSSLGAMSQSSTSQPTHDLNIDASRCSSVYGNSTTVQPESIVGMWLVKAYGVIVDTGTIDEQQYLDDRMADLKNVYLPANYVQNKIATVDITPATGFEIYNSESVFKASRTGNVVHVYGTLKPTTNIANAGNRDMGTLPVGYRPIGFIATICQGSDVNKWLLTVEVNGVMNASRYGANAYAQANTGTWMPFSVTFITTDAFPS